jgi:hypothetical protein
MLAEPASSFTCAVTTNSRQEAGSGQVVEGFSGQRVEVAAGSAVRSRVTWTRTARRPGPRARPGAPGFREPRRLRSRHRAAMPARRVRARSAWSDPEPDRQMAGPALGADHGTEGPPEHCQRPIRWTRLQQHLTFACEVTEEGAPRHTYPGGDLRRGGRIVAVSSAQTERCHPQVPACFLSAARHARSPPGTRQSLTLCGSVSD